MLESVAVNAIRHCLHTGGQMNRSGGERVRPVFVGALRASQYAQIDDGPDQPDNGNDQQQAPPGRLAAVMAALDVQHAASNQHQDTDYEWNDPLVTEQH